MRGGGIGAGMGDRAEERRLIEAARSGDEDAWELLYCRLYPRLFAFVARRVGTAEAEDVVNETMARAVTGIDNFRSGPGGFDGWVFGIARRVSADAYRRVQRAQRHPGISHSAEDRAGTEAGSDEDSYLAEEHRRVREAFDLLNPHERELLELRVVAGMSAKDVGAELGMTPGAVRTGQSRALSRLKTFIDRYNAVLLL